MVIKHLRTGKITLLGPFAYLITSFIRFGILFSGTTVPVFAFSSKYAMSFFFRKREALPWQLLQVLFCGVIR